MKFPTLIVLLLFTGICYGQDLSGKWLGEMPQVTSSLKYNMEANVIQKGDSLSGTIRYTAAQYWVVQTFKGAINGKTVTLHEYSVTGCNCVNGVKFCLKKMVGQLSIDAGKTFLVIDGDWTSESYYDGKNYVQGSCAPGKFLLARQMPPPPPPVKKELGPARRYVVTPGKKDSTLSNRPMDGYYKKTAVITSTVSPYANIREADVSYSKRVWREIDLREKFNTYLAAPKARLIDVIMDAVQTGDLLAYDPNPSNDDVGGDAFSKPLTPAEAFNRLSDSVLVTKYDANNIPLTSKMEAAEFNPDSIVRFRIKEDWIFDKQRSVFEPRIVGIAPMFKPKTTSGDVDYIPAFWIYFRDARKVFAKKAIAVNNNDATGLSFDDAFLKRMFAGYIVKVSNNKDERIKDYKDGIDRVYEGQRISKQLMDWELDLWQY